MGRLSTIASTINCPTLLTRFRQVLSRHSRDPVLILWSNLPWALGPMVFSHHSAGLAFSEKLWHGEYYWYCAAAGVITFFDAALFMLVLVLMTNIWRRLPSCLCRISQPFNQIKPLMLSSPLSSIFRWRFWPSSQQNYFAKVTVTSLPFHRSGQQIGNQGTSSLGHRCHWHWSPLTLLVNWDAQ